MRMAWGRGYGATDIGGMGARTILALDRVTIARMDAVVEVGFHAISRPVQA